MNLGSEMLPRSFFLVSLASLCLTALVGYKLIKEEPNPSEGIRITPLLSDLEHPWGMTWLPDGSMLITERPGGLKHFKEGQLREVSNVIPVFAAGQGGLLDVAVHPDFSKNGLVYFTYAHGNNSANHTRVGRAKFDGKTLTNWQVIWQSAPLKGGTQHFGSRLLWLPDGTLLVSIGDGGNPPLTLGNQLIREQAQNPRSYLGKIVRITAEGKVPPDNPFVKDPKTHDALWSLGHRNIQGLAFDPLTKTVWASEHGSRGGDELNQIQPGRNYGWPLVSATREYSTGRPIGKSSLPGMTEPVAVWQQAIAPSGLAVYRGDKFPEWQGNLFVGGLVGRRIDRLNMKGEILGTIPIGARVRDVRQGKDGFLYVLTDEPQGKLLRIAK